MCEHRALFRFVSFPYDTRPEEIKFEFNLSANILAEERRSGSFRWTDFVEHTETFQEDTLGN